MDEDRVFFDSVKNGEGKSTREKTIIISVDFPMNAGVGLQRFNIVVKIREEV